MAMTPSQLSIIVKSQGVEKAAQAVDSIVKKGGLSSEAADVIRKEILGIAQ